MLLRRALTRTSVGNKKYEYEDEIRKLARADERGNQQELALLQERIRGLAARSPGKFESQWGYASAAASASGPRTSFLTIRPGGQREPLIYDPKGYFVITLDRTAGQIVLRHYLPDHTPAHEMRGR